MKKISLLSTAAVALVLLTGCASAPESQTATVTSGSANEVYPQALSYAQQTHPGAVLVGYNNTGASFDRVNYVPTNPTVSGEHDKWVYMFVQDAADLNDGEINETETFAVELSGGMLNYVGYVETREQELEDYSVTGEDLLAVDTTAVLSTFLDSVEELTGERPQVEHVHFNNNAGGYEVSLFTSATTGFSGFFYLEDGTAPNVAPFTINTL